MNFLIGEILLCLIAASVLGVLVGWLLKTVITGKRVSRVETEWESKFGALDANRTREIEEISVKNDQLHNDITTQRNKLSALQSTLEEKDKALLKSRAESKSLTSALEEQRVAMESARFETDQISTTQKEIKHRLEAIVASKDQEIEELKNEISEAGSYALGTGGTPNAGIGSTAKGSPSTPAAFSEDARIKTLNEQRDRLIKERQQLEAREEHFSSRLTHGDDTRAYLDETMQMDQKSQELLDRSRQSAKSSPSTQQFSTVAGARPADEFDKDHNPKTLWDKVKSTVNKTVDKTKI